MDEKTKQALYRQEQKFAKQLIKIEKEKWGDAEHCTCLGYAIVTVFGEKWEKELLKDRS